jgi:hypothetical protein
MSFCSILYAYSRKNTCFHVRYKYNTILLLSSYILIVFAYIYIKNPVQDAFGVADACSGGVDGVRDDVDRVSGIRDVTVMALMGPVCWLGAYIQYIRLILFFYAHNFSKSSGLRGRTWARFHAKSQAHVAYLDRVTNQAL